MTEGPSRRVVPRPRSPAASGAAFLAPELVLRLGELGRRVRAIARGGGSLHERWDEIWSVVDPETLDRLLFHDEHSARLNRSLWEASELRNTSEMFRALTRRAPSVPALIHRVHSTEIPSLVLVGLYDRNVGVDSSRDLATVLPNSRSVVFERSGHFPDIEQPDDYVTTVREFLGW